MKEKKKVPATPGEAPKKRKKPEPLRLRVRKTYQTRDGSKVYIRHRKLGGMFPYIGVYLSGIFKGLKDCWMIDGTDWVTHKSDGDLVREVKPKRSGAKK